MLAKLVEYQCVAKDHEATLTHPDKLTIYKGQWAFCAYDSLAGGHEWRATGGADLESLLRQDHVALSSRALTSGAA